MSNFYLLKSSEALRKKRIFISVFYQIYCLFSSHFFSVCDTCDSKKSKTRLERARIRTCDTFNRFYLQAYLYTPMTTKNFLTKYPRFAIQRYHSAHLLQEKMHFFEFLRLFCALSHHICIEQLIYQLYQTIWAPTRENNPFHDFND